MAIRVIDDTAELLVEACKRQLVKAERLAATVRAFSVHDRDPFIFAAPCWRVRVAPQLPHVVPNTRPSRLQMAEKDRQIIMAIRAVEASQAPQRLFVRGGISSKQDYVELLQALNGAKPNQAFVVDMDPKAWVKSDGQPIDKPEVVFANSLRRRFDASGLPVTAYMSGKLQITVRRLTELELKERHAGKGKRAPKKK